MRDARDISGAAERSDEWSILHMTARVTDLTAMMTSITCLGEAIVVGGGPAKREDEGDNAGKGASATNQARTQQQNAIKCAKSIETNLPIVKKK